MASSSLWIKSPLSAMSTVLLEWGLTIDSFLPLPYNSQVTIFVAQVVMALYLFLGILNREVMRSAVPWREVSQAFEGF